MDIRFFPTPKDFGSWLKKNHAKEKELLVGFYKKDSGKPSITWPESVDEALCYGWIDGVRRNIDAESYSIRFTPRKPGSIWSKINIDKMEKLSSEGRMQPAGLKAFEARKEERSRVYSYEQEEDAQLDAAEEKAFRANKKAWDFFMTQAPSYRKTAFHWVVRSKKEETRKKRMAQLIDESAQGLRAKPFRRP